MLVWYCLQYLLPSVSVSVDMRISWRLSMTSGGTTSCTTLRRHFLAFLGILLSLTSSFRFACWLTSLTCAHVACPSQDSMLSVATARASRSTESFRRSSHPSPHFQVWSGQVYHGIPCLHLERFSMSLPRLHRLPLYCIDSAPRTQSWRVGILLGKNQHARLAGLTLWLHAWKYV